MDSEPRLPIAISLINNKFLVFDVDTVSYLRRQHHICGVMTGSLPQNPSQNLFLGLPLQIMPEEAQLVIEKGVGYVLDDPHAHDRAIHNFDSARHADYMANVRRKREQAGKIRSGIKKEQKKVALNKQKGKNFDAGKDIVDEMADMKNSPPIDAAQDAAVEETNPKDESSNEGALESESLFSDGGPPVSQPSTNAQSNSSLLLSDLPLITPTSSALLLREAYLSDTRSSLPTNSNDAPSPKPNIATKVPNLPASYPLYRHLNSKGYFTTPGLRFGCQYSVYPGDPLRYHSHFLAVSYAWDEEIDLMDLVGGGRLGTGVKKGWLIGGEEEPGTGDADDVGVSSMRTEDANGDKEDTGVYGAGDTDDVVLQQKNQSKVNRVRTFSIEWAVM